MRSEAAATVLPSPNAAAFAIDCRPKFAIKVATLLAFGSDSENIAALGDDP
jgi:hypothetical protein